MDLGASRHGERGPIQPAIELVGTHHEDRVGQRTDSGPQSSAGQSQSRVPPPPRPSREDMGSQAADRQSESTAVCPSYPSYPSRPSRQVASSQPAPGSRTPTGVDARQPAHATEMSELENLPIDLREKLILRTLEPNLARASRLYGRTMSKEEIYRVFVLFAFFENPEGLPMEDSYFHPASYQVLSESQRLDLQRDILECRWSTWSRIKACIDTLVHVAVIREYRSEQKKRKSGVQTEACPPPTLEEMIVHFQGSHRHPDAHITCTRTISHPSRRFYFSKDAVQFSCIPRRALNPDRWDDESFEYLLFVQLHLPRFVKPPVYERFSLYEGMEKAIKQHAFKPLFLLAALHNLRYEHERRRAADAVELVLPTRLFHLASQQGDDSVWMLELLVAVRRPRTAEAEAVLTKWALDRSSTRPTFSAPRENLARWVLEEMKCTEPTKMRRPPQTYMERICHNSWDGPGYCERYLDEYLIALLYTGLRGANELVRSRLRFR